MKSSTSDPNSFITPCCMPRPKPSSRMSMKTPQKTPKAVNNVRNLFWRRVKRISCRPSNTLISPGRRLQRVDLPRRHDQAVLQEDLALGLISDILLVSHNDEGVASLVDLFDQRHDFPGGVTVEGTRWLIGENHLRSTDQRARNGHALLLTP